MRELSPSEVEKVSGGILPALAVVALIVAGGSGCAHTKGVRRGEKPSK